MDDIPNEVQSFVRENLHSLGMLELLLALEAQPERAWTLAELSAEVRVHRDGLTTQLDHLRRRGLVACEGKLEPRFRYGAARSETRSTIAKLRRTFETRRVRLATLLYGEPPAGCRSPRGDGVYHGFQYPP